MNRVALAACLLTLPALAHAQASPTLTGKWTITLLFIVLSPLIGMVLAYLLMVSVYWCFRRFTPAQMDRHFLVIDDE